VAAEAFPSRAQALLLAELANMSVREAALWSLCHDMKTGLYERSMTRNGSAEPEE
jgi:hypothetical protein